MLTAIPLNKKRTPSFGAHAQRLARVLKSKKRWRV